MKHFFLSACLLLTCLLPAMGQGAAPQQEEPRRKVGEVVVDGLLQLGGKALNNYLEREIGTPQVAQPAATDAAAAPDEPRTWRERGSDMFKSFLAKSVEEMGNEPLGRWLAHALKQALDVLLDEYKDQYKAEGRAYAQELGDKMLERVREDPKISSSITSLQILCWCVIGYLTLVTLIMLFSLLYLKRANGRLMATVEALSRKLAAK